MGEECRTQEEYAAHLERLAKLIRDGSVRMRRFVEEQPDQGSVVVHMRLARTFAMADDTFFSEVGQ